MIIWNYIRQKHVIHVKEFFLYSKGNEPLKSFKTGREMFRHAGSKLANRVIV